MIRRALGFTIIELILAVAITILLTTLAIPRYTNYHRQLDFQAQVRTFVTCLQAAQQDAAAQAQNVQGAQSSYRFVKANFSMASTKFTGCQVSYYPYGFQANNGDPGIVVANGKLDFADGTVVPAIRTDPAQSASVGFCSVNYHGGSAISTSGLTEADFYFDALQSGRLWGMAFPPNFAFTNSFGNGYSIDLNLVEAGGSCTAAGVPKAVITLPPAGSPIQIIFK